MKTIIKLVAYILTFLMFISTCEASLAVFAADLREGAAEERINAAVDFDDIDVKAEPYVVREDTTGRQEYEKRYILSDGSYMTAVYGEPIHYLNDGEWIDIDNSLEEDKNGYRTSAPGKFSAEFDSTDSNRIFSVEKDGHIIEMFFAAYNEVDASSEKSFSKNIEVEEKNDEVESFDVKDVYSLIEEATRENKDLTSEDISAVVDEQNEINVRQRESVTDLENLSSKIRYSDAFGNADLEYTVSPSAVKENIVINEKEDEYVYSFVFDTDLTPVLNDDNSIEFVDGENAAVFSMPAPYMFDADGDISLDVEYTLEGDTLTVTASSEWINAPERAFPVTVDPTIVGERIASLEINKIFDKYPNNHYSGNAGYTSVGFDHGYEYRTLLRFSSLPDFAENSVIESAILRLRVYDYDITDPDVARLDTYAFENTETWNTATVSWNTKPATEAKPFDYQVITINHASNLNYDITDLMEKWYTGESDYAKGITLKVDDSYSRANYDTFGFIRTANYGSTNHPVLTLKFRSSAGLDDRYSYSDYSASDAGTVYVGNNTGNMILVKDLADGKDVDMPAQIGLIYNAARFGSDGQSFGVGCGWRINYHETIKLKKIDNVDYYVYTTADGTELLFTRDSQSGTIKDTEDLGYTLTLVNGYEITFDDDYSKHFDSLGRLTEIADGESGDSVTVDYLTSVDGDYRISKVTDGDGNEYTFSYNAGLISTLTDPDENVTSFTHQVDNLSRYQLVGVTDPDGNTASYSYDTNSLYIGMISASGSDGHGLSFDYTGTTHKRISEVAETYGLTEGSSVYYDIHARYSVLSDELGNSVSYQFDSTGKLTSVLDGQGYAQYYDYFDGSGSMGLINSVSRLEKAAVNMASDPSFETLTTNVNTLADNVLDGAKSAHISGQNEYIRETFTGIPGETYTASVYVKCGTLTQISSDRGAYILVSSGNETWQSNKVRSTPYNGGWDRLAVTFTVPANGDGTVNVDLKLAGATGDAYFDLLAIDKDDVVNKVNLVTDGDFDNTSAATMTTMPASLSGKAITLSGSPLSAASYSREINISGIEGEELTFGSYAKADSAAQRDGITFALKAELYSGNDLVGENSISFNEHVRDWQYVCGSVIAEDDFDSVVLTYLYDYNINIAYFDGLTLYLEPLGTKYTYYDDGNIKTIVTPGESTVYYEYNSDGDMTLCRVVGESETVYVYDNDRKLLYSETAIAGDTVTYETVVYTYSGDDVLTETVYAVDYSSIGSASPVMQTVNTYTNSKISSQTVTDNMTAGKTIVDVYAYDANGNVTSTVKTVTDGNETKTTSTSAVYDVDGNLTSSTDEMGNVTSYTYNGDGKVAAISISDGTNTKSQSYTYTNGNMTLLTGSATGCTNISVALSYADGNVSSIVTPTTTYSYSYDAMDRYTGVSVGNHALESVSYDAVGRQSSKSFGNGDSIIYGYDPSYLLTSVTVDANKTYTYGYNADGQIGSVYDPYLDETEAYLYNIEGTLIKREVTGGDTVWYDKDGKVAASLIGGDYYVTEQDGDTTSFSSDTVSASVVYSLDDFGRIETRSLGGGTNPFFDVTYSYKAAGSNETSLVDTINAGAFTFSYSYDGFGNATEIRRNNSLTNRYEYDGYGRVVREDLPSAVKTFTYSYDDAGNITEKKEYSYTTGSLANKTPLDVVSYTYGDSTWGDLLTSYDGQTITYDNIGNPLSYRGKTLTWNGRQLRSVGNTVYTYDINGLRTSKTVGNTTTFYTWEDGNLIHQTDGTISLHIWYGENGAEAFTYIIGSTSETYYYVKDALGNVIGIYDDTGDMLVRYDYDAWGRLRTTWYKNDDYASYSYIGNINPIRYKGYFYDKDTGFYYLQSRYYDPITGRFLNADDINSISANTDNLSQNLFEYCNGNPVNMIDVDGYAPQYVTNQGPNVTVQGMKMKNISYGFGNIANHGCGVIAAYNVFLYYNSSTKFLTVRNEMVLWGCPWLLGYWGTEPSRFTVYLTSRFLSVITEGPITWTWGIRAELSECVIVLFKWKGWSGLHYIAGIRTGYGGVGGSFRFYNTGLKYRGKNLDGKAVSIWDVINSIKSDGGTPVLLIGLRWKQWWW